METLTLIFASYNGAHTLPRMLEALCGLAPTRRRLRVLAVDNGSTDGSGPIMAGYRERLPLTVLTCPQRGKNHALNLALAEGVGELVVFTDDDVLPAPDWLQQLEAAADAQPEADLFGGAILPYWEREPEPWLLAHTPRGVTWALTSPEQPAGPVFPGLIWGPNMMVRGKVFAAGHRFNTAVGPAQGQYIMGSETEFTLRVAALGHACRFVPEARVQHIIRPQQTDPAWIVQRAWRFGRNQYLQEARGLVPPGAAALTADVPRLAGVPRWMFRRYLGHALGYLGARLRDREEGMFTHAWEMAYLRGYFHQAWRGRG